MSMKGNAYRNIILISQIGITVMVPIFLCMMLGIWLGNTFGQWLAVLMVFFGIAAGARNGYVLVTDIVKSEEARRRKFEEHEIARKLEKARQIKLDEQLRD